MKMFQSRFIGLKGLGKARMELTGQPAVRLSCGTIVTKDGAGTHLYTSTGEKIVPVEDVKQNEQMRLMK